MKHLCAALVLVAIPCITLAADPTLKDARARCLHGNIAEARSQYETLAKDGKTRPAAVIGLSKTWEQEGEYEKALDAVDAALKDLPKNADLHARRAELLYLRGKWPEAEKAAETALSLKKDDFLARWVRAQMWRDRGDVKQADAEFRWFVKTYSDRSNADNDIKDADELLLVGLAGAENARWHNLSDQFKVILNDVYGDALKADKDFWPAEYQAGMLLLEKYNKPEALEAFDKALKINPTAAEALVGKGLAALQDYQTRDAENFAERALKSNPNLPEALRLRADIHLLAGDVSAAMKDLAKARKVNPRDEATLARVAACLLLQRKEAEFDELVKEVTKHDPKPGLFYYELGQRLDERRLFDTAEKYYQQAIKDRPQLAWPRTALGMLHMRMGREKEARDILSKAYEADIFNVRLANTLKVLRHLEKYETIKTAHFELRFDPKNDKALGRYMAQFLEETYAELAETFHYKPKGPFVVEVFNNHDMFSGRVVALPDLHTIGACTGRMMAMVSPRGEKIGKPFNWARVVRHELVHIFNLDQTNFQVPHWLTEGLAVANEGFPRPQPWNQMLVERVPAGDLMNLDNINMGFIRPKTPMDWQMAYCQSLLYVEYLRGKYGPQSIGEMLAAYRDGLDTAAAIQKVCKVDKATFEKGYREHLNEVVKQIKGKPVEKPMTLAQLRDAHEKKPEDADIAARLAERYLMQRRTRDARRLVEPVLAKNKAHPLATYVLARIQLDGGAENKDVIALLKEAVDPKAPDAKVLMQLGKLYYEEREADKAAETFELGRKAEPYESKWLVELARVYTQAGNKDKLIAVLKDLVPTDADELHQRRQLARLLMEANRPAEAEKYARQALEIDVLDREAQELMQKALLAQKKDAEAERLRKLLEK